MYAPMDNDWFVKIPLRFRVKDRVDCLLDGVWQPGTIIETNCRDEEDELLPYNVQLDDGNMCYASNDDDCCIRKSVGEKVCRV